MKDELIKKSDGYMPREIAIIFLTNKHSKTASFRRRCFHAMEKVVEPVSRSTRFNVSAPKTGSQRLQARLQKANAAQLHKWAKRTQYRGNRYQDLLFEAQANGEEKLSAMLQQQIAAHDALCQAISAELTSRASRGIGYRKPIKYAGI